jgi:hypothetical protein
LEQLDIEQHAEALTDNLEGDKPVVILNRFDAINGDPALKALIAATFVAGKGLMPIDRGNHPSVDGLKDFVALELGVAVPEAGPEAFGVNSFGDVGQFIGRGQIRAPKPSFPTAFVAVLLEFVEAGQPAAEHGEKGSREDLGGDLWFGTRVAHMQLPLPAEAEDFFGVVEQSS